MVVATMCVASTFLVPQKAADLPNVLKYIASSLGMTKSDLPTKLKKLVDEANTAVTAGSASKSDKNDKKDKKDKKHGKDSKGKSDKKASKKARKDPGNRSDDDMPTKKRHKFRR